MISQTNHSTHQEVQASTDLSNPEHPVDSHCFEHSDANQLVRNPLVSVVMLAYNHESYLAEAIEGVIGQVASFPIELIIGEDCSTDRTREIAFEYQQRFPKQIRVQCSAHNIGMQQNFRRTISAARGTYVAFCEGDDWWHRSDKLSRQIQAFTDNPELALVCSAIRYADDGGKVTGTNLDSHRAPTTAITTYDIIMGGIASTCTSIIKRLTINSIINNSSFCAPLRYPFSDSPLFLELVAGYECVRLEEELSTYRVSQGSVSRPSDPYRRRWFQLRSYRFRCDAIRAFPISPATEQTRFARKWIRARLRLAAEIGDAEEARTAFSDCASFGIEPGFLNLAYFRLACVPINRHPLFLLAQRLLKTQ